MDLIFQSTHLREVRQSSRSMRRFRMLIFQSTHLREVRPALLAPCWALSTISIHAPTWGATLNNQDIRDLMSISIHAPTWGATVLFVHRTKIVLHFNPRTYVRCDMAQRHCLERWFKFQSTHLREVRRCGCRSYVLCFEISIHAPTWGATLKMQRVSLVKIISIHAPTWGATQDY